MIVFELFMWNFRWTVIIFRMMKFQHTKRFFPVESPSYNCAVLWWQELKLLLMHACKKNE
jgi:hypothetical protein